MYIYAHIASLGSRWDHFLFVSQPQVGRSVAETCAAGVAGCEPANPDPPQTSAIPADMRAEMRRLQGGILSGVHPPAARHTNMEVIHHSYASVDSMTEDVLYGCINIGNQTMSSIDQMIYDTYNVVI
jgi:hypothetical protein